MLVELWGVVEEIAKLAMGFAATSDEFTGTTYNDTTVTDGTTYFYSVRAYNGTESPDSNESSVRTIGDFTISATSAPTSTTIQVTFGAGTGATAYDVKYGTTSGTYSTTLSSVTSPYTISGLASGTNYYIVVRARNAIGGTAFNQTAEVSQVTPVGAPTGLTATSSSSKVDLSWTAAGGATNYNIYRSGTSGGPYTQIASAIAAVTYSDTTVTNGSSYYYVIRSYNGAESANSNEAIGQPLDTPTIGAITGTATTLTINWSGITGASRYDVRWGTSTGSYTTTANSVTSPYTITGLTANTTYYIVVRAWGPLGLISFTSSEVSANTAPVAPVGLTASASSGQVGLNWTATAGATSYKVYRGTTSGSLTLLNGSVASNAFLDTTVSNGTTYFYAVMANNGKDSALSSEVSVRPIGAFSISALTALSSTSASITWGPQRVPRPMT